MEKQLLKQIIDEANEYKINFLNKRKIMCDKNLATNRAKEKLPNQWLWDMVDEFVYQFQSFCQYWAKMKYKTEQEIALLRQHDQGCLELRFNNGV
ncbi:eukaryotic translation initiation factor 3 subunit L [Artemisia annua]|uniref:Eukaryotic translation initiation factor 3 subunit L n=1 Tax=Artemisia annua TaxID=35608 RepID=A0A2U1NGM9_ARTAN|nr:eukaryotic translation initiation factor 3 subunit L [Artemisia annua]